MNILLSFCRKIINTHHHTKYKQLKPEIQPIIELVADFQLNEIDIKNLESEIQKSEENAIIELERILSQKYTKRVVQIFMKYSKSDLSYLV
jgi:ABC-type uncharacterized transport system auxiliary subunit